MAATGWWGGQGNTCPLDAPTWFEGQAQQWSTCLPCARPGSIPGAKNAINQPMVQLTWHRGTCLLPQLRGRLRWEDRLSPGVEGHLGNRARDPVKKK